MHKTAPSRLLPAGDIGGTKTRLGPFSRIRKGLTLVASRKYDGLEAIISEFLQDYKQVPAVSSDVAGPIVKGSLRAANRPWAFSEHALIRFRTIPNVAPIPPKSHQERHAVLLGAAVYAAGVITER